ncbi:MAG: phosphomethylpyrimidine synthase ThiC [Candidatus Syntropharchaeia archaeon]
MDEEIRLIARIEGVEPEKLERLVKSGRVVILDGENPKAIGEGMTTKINANVGTSKDYINVNEEVEKAKTAVEFGADTVMDLSTGGNLDETRRKILKAVDVPVGTVPIYQAGLEGKRPVVDMTSDDMFNAVRKHAKDGVKFVTIHAGVNLNSLERLKKSERILDVVSRGGSFTIAWMIHNERENPFYEEYDYLLEIAHEYDLTLSLGDGMRPGCISDASDRAKFMEFIVLGELVKRAREKGVKAIVEGPGHVPLDEIGLSVSGMKHLTGYAPLYLLGPLVTDLAPGYDHIVGSIGGAIAGMYGADFLCMTTPSEHLALPTVDDIKEGVIITKIAAHIADTVKAGQRERARAMDREMAYARKNLDWEKQFELAIDGEKPRRIRKKRPSNKACSMCGDLCAIKMVKEALKKFNQNNGRK